MDDATAQRRLAAQRTAQYRQVAQLDLLLETTPRDSRFSSHLLELMKKEEVLMREGGNTAAVGQKVDELLRQETGAFFNKVAVLNSRKWQALRSKLGDDRKTARVSSVAASSAKTSQSAQPAQVTAADLDREAARLEADYYKNWYHYEMLHLQEAFKSQHSKIDHEWGGHETALLNDYHERREKIVGKDPGASRVPHSLSLSMDSSGDRRWHHPEKQQTLIHTAPVLTPQRPTNGSSSRQRRPSGAALGELQKIEREYEDSLAALHRQKADAQRWLSRQQLRFSAQCEELRKEKSLVAQILEDILAEFPL